MPCRALEAFRLSPGRRKPPGGKKGSVLMPCRALEAFRPVQDAIFRFVTERVLMPCRALEAFRHDRWHRISGPFKKSLNALSGIGGVQTSPWSATSLTGGFVVLMPCRALEAFRHGDRGLAPGARA